MHDQLLTIGANLKAIIADELPSDETKMAEFIRDLDNRFPDFPRTIREIFENEFEKRFCKKFCW